MANSNCLEDKELNKCSLSFSANEDIENKGKCAVMSGKDDIGMGEICGSKTLIININKMRVNFIITIYSFGRTST